MQPSNLKLTKKAKGLARAKMLMKTHLYWLMGCPVFEDNKLLWLCPLSSNSLVTITPKMVSKSQRIVNELLKDFPIALPKIVGDSKIWFTRCHEYLDYYKQLVKKTDKLTITSLFSLNQDFKKKTSRYFPENSSKFQNNLIASLSWLHYIDRKPLKNSMKFIKHYESKINENKLSKESCLQLIYLYASEGKRATGLINLIFNTCDINVCMIMGDHHFNNFIECKIPNSQKKSNLERPPLTEFNNDKTLVEFLRWCVEAKPSQQKRALSLINSFDLNLLITQWFNWWNKVDGICLKIENLIKYADKFKGGKLLTLQKKLKNLQKNKPTNLDIKHVITVIKYFSQYQDTVQALQMLFTSLPKQDTSNKYNYPTRVQFLFYFHLIALHGALKLSLLPNYILLLAKYIKAHPKTYQNAPWQNLEAYYWGTLEATLFDELKPKDFERFFNILTHIQKHVSIDSDKTERVITLASCKFSDERTISLCLYLLENNHLGYIPKIVLKMMEYYDLNNQQILQLLKIWDKFNEEFTDDDTLEVMFNTFNEMDAAEIFKQLFFLGHANALRQDCYQVRIIKKLSSVKHIPHFSQNNQQADDWIENYPKVFHLQLKQLNKSSSKAEKKATKIFSAHWWTKPMIKDQIALIQTQINKSNQEQSTKLLPRLTNLTTKLKNHKDITPSEQDKIQSKLDDLIIKENYGTWKQHLFSTFKKFWLDLFDLQYKHVPKWFFSADIIYKLMPIIDFGGIDKKLAIAVVQNRCKSNNPDDWQLLNHPQNKQFITKMKSLGFDMDIWIKGIAAQTYQAQNADAITLSIAKDPLEILNMGAYFKTCLSPTSFNYFSVFANIADINKQLIYAKNAKGKVVGRVLIGITEIGGLMTYHLYFHNAQQGFNKFALEYIDKWAKKVGLTLTNNGEVSTLVATNWYDDGAIEVDNGINCFKQDSDFRKSIATIKPEDFIQLLKQNLKPSKLTPITFSMLVSLPELPENKALFPILIDLAQQLTFVHDEDKIKLYKLSHEMGYPHYYTYFRSTAIKYQNKKLKDDQWLDVDLGILMAKNSPTDGLTLIKKYGRIKSKKWQNNLYYHTHKIAVIALNNLERKQQAIEIEKFYEG